MDIWEMNPYIRYMDQRKCFISYDKPVLAYDYRLFAVCEGECFLEIWEQQIKLNAGNVVVFPPAVPYRLLFDPAHPSVLYDINFSLSFCPGEPIPPDTEDEFKYDRMPQQPDENFFSEPLCSEVRSDLCGKIGEILWEYEHEGSDALCSAMLKEVLIRLMQTAERKQETDDLAEKIAFYLDLHCRDQLDAKQIGQQFGYHPFYLNRIFRKRFQCTMHRFQMNCRIKRACSMLKATQLSIQEIADSLGFARNSYFSEFFRSVTGMTPTEYRHQNAGQTK